LPHYEVRQMRALKLAGGYPRPWRPARSRSAL
jgi:hypothetical protein